MNNPDNDVLNFILNDTNKDCRSNYFHTIEYRCVYHRKFTNTENNEEVISSITLEYMEYNFQLHGLSKKTKNARINGSI